ncbi:hypothetical protein ACWGLE_06350 [Streptomyces sp. NPDC055897]
MVIISPANPSDTAKLEPIDVSRPMGRISVVTIAKIPIITETTASQETRGERRAGAAEAPLEVAVAVDINPVPYWTSTGVRPKVQQERQPASGRFTTPTTHIQDDVAFPR